MTPLPASASSRPPPLPRRTHEAANSVAPVALAAAWTMPIRRTRSSDISVSTQSE